MHPVQSRAKRLILVLSLFIGTVSGAAAAPLQFLGNAELPPMVWRHNGQTQGVVVDLVKAAALAADLDIEVQGRDWKLAQEALKAGTVDALIQINPNPQRLLIYDFSDPLLDSDFHIFRRTKRAEISGIASLSGKRVAVEASGFPAAYLKDFDQINVVTASDWKQAFEMLEADQVDAVFVDRWVGEYNLYQYKFKDIAIVETPVVSLQSRIAVQKGNIQLLSKINDGLREINLNGTRRNILEKWRAKEVIYLTREAFDAALIWASVVAAAILLALCTWLYFQRQRLKAVNSVLKQRMADIQKLQLELSEQVLRDPLTGLYNRRYMDETLVRDLVRAKRDGHPLAVIMLDLDRFKQVNDTYGHSGGDEVLKSVAAILQDGARESDIVCRYGGEEFLVVLPRMTTPQALLRVSLWQQRLSATPIKHGELSIVVTFSAGVSAYPEHATEPDALITKADQALYISKKEGRNRFTAADS